MAAAIQIRSQRISSSLEPVSAQIVSVLLLLILSLGCISSMPASASDEASELRGRWLAKSAMRDGQRTDDVVGHVLAFKEKTFVIRAQDKSVLFEGTYILQRDKSPPTIDFRHRGKKLKGTIWKGIYERKGNRLKICDNAAGTQKSRPTEFEAPRDSGYILIMFDRIK